LIFLRVCMWAGTCLSAVAWEPVDQGARVDVPQAHREVDPCSGKIIF
jgi:hypothetical protein